MFKVGNGFKGVEQLIIQYNNFACFLNDLVLNPVVSNFCLPFPLGGIKRFRQAIVIQKITIQDHCVFLYISNPLDFMKAWFRRASSARAVCYQGDQVSDSKMADSVQVEEPQRRAVGGTITTGRIHKGKDLDDQLYMIKFISHETEIEVILFDK